MHAHVLGVLHLVKPFDLVHRPGIDLVVLVLRSV